MSSRARDGYRRLGSIGCTTALAASALLLAACGPGSRVGEDPRPAAPGPLPASQPVKAPTDVPRGEEVVAAVRAGELDRVYHLVLQTLERCGTRPLGQQALLLLAAAELDPRNPDPRLSLALEATAIVLRAAPPGAWNRQLAESLYLVGLRLGAREPSPAAADESELRWRARRGDAAEEPSRGVCEALPWPDGRLADGAELPAPSTASYPAQIARLQRHVARLQEEVDRLRRITSEP